MQLAESEKRCKARDGQVQQLSTALEQHTEALKTCQGELAEARQEHQGCAVAAKVTPSRLDCTPLSCCRCYTPHARPHLRSTAAKSQAACVDSQRGGRTMRCVWHLSPRPKTPLSPPCDVQALEQQRTDAQAQATHLQAQVDKQCNAAETAQAADKREIDSLKQQLADAKAEHKRERDAATAKLDASVLQRSERDKQYEVRADLSLFFGTPDRCASSRQ